MLLHSQWGSGRWGHPAFMVCRAVQYPLLLASAFPELAATMPITVMLVEDDPEFLTRFCGIVAADADLELFAAVTDCASARQAISKSGPDVLLTDLGLPDGSGVEIIRETARHYPGADIMVVTVFGDEGHVIQAIEAGATGYILKDSIPEEFVGLIKQLRNGGSPISPRPSVQSLLGSCSIGSGTLPSRRNPIRLQTPSSRRASRNCYR
jgi:DNA-binding NarL/FixJ family response regulator